MSRHFSLAELCESEYAIRHRLPNTPDEASEANLIRLMPVLETVREVLGNRPIVISSGYRSPEVNRGVGGSRTSAHLEGRAADIKVVGLTPYEVACVLRDAKLPLDQLIYEGTWTHVGITAENSVPRQDILTAQFNPGGTVYLKGIHA